MNINDIYTIGFVVVISLVGVSQWLHFRGRRAVR